MSRDDIENVYETTYYYPIVIECCLVNFSKRTLGKRFNVNIEDIAGEIPHGKVKAGSDANDKTEIR